MARVSSGAARAFWRLEFRSASNSKKERASSCNQELLQQKWWSGSIRFCTGNCDISFMYSQPTYYSVMKREKCVDRHNETFDGKHHLKGVVFTPHKEVRSITYPVEPQFSGPTLRNVGGSCNFRATALIQKYSGGQPKVCSS